MPAGVSSFLIAGSVSGSSSPAFANGWIESAWPMPDSASNASGALPPWMRVAIAWA